jgi:hypothetical protein
VGQEEKRNTKFESFINETIGGTRFMNTRILMTTSAALMGFMGLGALFLPQEILAFCGLNAIPVLVLFIQVCGALLLGFAMLNWMARGNLLGGIYSRPVSVGNLVHFFVGGIVLMKGAIAHPGWPLSSLTVLYVAFAVSFALVVFGNPMTEKTPAAG